MKILVVCGAGKLYGRETVTLSLMKGLRNRGHDVECVTSSWSDGKFEKHVKELSFRSRPLPLGFISKTLSLSALKMTLVQAWRLPELWIGYRRATKSFRPDIVLHSTLHHVFLLCPLFGREVNVFHVHDSFAPTRFYHRLFKLLGKRLSAFVGVSRFIAESIAILGIPKNKISCVLNGIAEDTSGLYPAISNASNLSNINLPDESIRVGIVGQVDEWKGHEDLIDALGILKENRLSFVCRIFGSGRTEFSTRLRLKIDAYGLTDKVEWMGYVDERKAIYDKIDVCVVPSRIPEAFGMVAAEALMYGVPVIGSRLGALPEVIQNELTGYLVDAGSAEQIAEKIRLLSSSPKKRMEMGRTAKTRVSETLSADRMISEMEALLRSLVFQNLHSI